MIIIPRNDANVSMVFFLHTERTIIQLSSGANCTPKWLKWNNLLEPLEKNVTANCHKRSLSHPIFIFYPSLNLCGTCSINHRNDLVPYPFPFLFPFWKFPPHSPPPHSPLQLQACPGSIPCYNMSWRIWNITSLHCSIFLNTYLLGLSIFLALCLIPKATICPPVMPMCCDSPLPP